MALYPSECRMSYVEIISIIKDFILASAAITGATVAVKGLGTWQRQLKGQSEYELSRRILVSLFKYRDAIARVRHPVLWAYEMPSPTQEKAKSMNNDQIEFYGTSKAYQVRLDKVQTERTNLYADMLEAEAIWGSELNSLFKVVFDLQHELFTKIRLNLELMNPDTRDAQKKAIIKIAGKFEDIIYSHFGDEPDKYKKDLLDAIESIELYFKPKLNHEKV
jgi:hypothetical protein